MSNALNEFSDALTAAVEKGGAGTVLVAARRRYPASGIAYAADLVLTADHVVTRDEKINVAAADWRHSQSTIAGALSPWLPAPHGTASALRWLRSFARRQHPVPVSPAGLWSTRTAKCSSSTLLVWRAAWL